MKLLELNTSQKKFIQEICRYLIGLPYKLGAEVNLNLTPKELKEKNKPIDCSELVEYVFYQLGYKIPDGSYNQYDASEFVNDIQIGDLVFRRSKQTKQICHSGIIVDEKNFSVVEALGGKGVVERKLEDFKKESKNSVFAGVKRLILDRIKVL